MFSLHNKFSIMPDSPIEMWWPRIPLEDVKDIAAVTRVFAMLSNNEGIDERLCIEQMERKVHIKDRLIDAYVAGLALTFPGHMREEWPFPINRTPLKKYVRWKFKTWSYMVARVGRKPTHPVKPQIQKTITTANRSGTTLSASIVLVDGFDKAFNEWARKRGINRVPA